MHSIDSLQYYIPRFLSLRYVQSYLFFLKFWRAGPCLSGWEKEKFHSRLWRRQWHSTPVLLPGKSHGQRSLEGCSPWGRQESDTTEWLYFHFSLSCIGEGNGNPLQCSCLENPRDGGAWWAAVYGVLELDTTEATKQFPMTKLVGEKFYYRNGMVLFIMVPNWKQPKCSSTG